MVASPTVMIAEDEPATRRLYRFLLSNSGYQVLEADDGEAALSILEREPCAVLITDLNMPNLNGLELTSMLRARGSSIYIIMVTAFGTDDVEHDALAQGVNEYLIKPFEFEDLEARLKRFFQSIPASSEELLP